jgi:hypothetical protein
MARKKSKTKPMPVFDSIRKPTAPPSRKLEPARPAEKVYPTGRKAKHKAQSGRDDINGDLQK